MPELERKDGMQSYESCIIMLRALEQVITTGVPGDVVEIGCHTGASSVMFGEMISRKRSEKTLHLYDSFQGLSSLAIQDVGSPVLPGELAASQFDVVHRFNEDGIPQPVIHPGWVADTLPGELPDKICFALIDVDFYDPILHSLKAVYPRLSPGAVCIIDDALSSAFPGAHMAAMEFADSEGIVLVRFGSHQLGFFTPTRDMEKEE